MAHGEEGTRNEVGPVLQRDASSVEVRRVRPALVRLLHGLPRSLVRTDYRNLTTRFGLAEGFATVCYGQAPVDRGGSALVQDHWSEQVGIRQGIAGRPGEVDRRASPSVDEFRRRSNLPPAMARGGQSALFPCMVHGVRGVVPQSFNLLLEVGRWDGRVLQWLAEFLCNASRFARRSCDELSAFRVTERHLSDGSRCYTAFATRHGGGRAWLTYRVLPKCGHNSTKL